MPFSIPPHITNKDTFTLLFIPKSIFNCKYLRLLPRNMTISLPSCISIGSRCIFNSKALIRTRFLLQWQCAYNSLGFGNFLDLDLHWTPLEWSESTVTSPIPLAAVLLAAGFFVVIHHFCRKRVSSFLGILLWTPVISLDRQLPTFGFRHESLRIHCLGTWYFVLGSFFTLPPKSSSRN